MNKNAASAAHALKYYFKMIAQKSGVNWDGDNDAEIEGIVESILDAAADYVNEAMDEHNNADVSIAETVKNNADAKIYSKDT